MSKVVRVYKDPTCPLCESESVRPTGTRIDCSDFVHRGWQCECGFHFEADQVKVPLTDQQIKTLIERRRAKAPQSPDFAPSDGVCYSCYRQLVEFYGERWETQYITGCPLCHRSFCD